MRLDISHVSDYFHRLARREGIVCLFSEKDRMYLSQPVSAHVIHIIPTDGGKTCSMQRILDRYGIPREESMAFYNSGNDIEMLCYAGIGVAMGNVSQEVKDAADYITAE